MSKQSSATAGRASAAALLQELTPNALAWWSRSDSIPRPCHNCLHPISYDRNEEIEPCVLCNLDPRRGRARCADHRPIERQEDQDL